VIVPPTSQNQIAIEADLRDFVQSHLDLDDHTLGHRCEQVIRNYDPCISCATHFLRFSSDRPAVSQRAPTMLDRQRRRGERHDRS
jgi:sulfhydrogenase subunit alpha